MCKEALYMDQKGLDKLTAEIEELKAKLKTKSTFNREDTTDGYNTSIAEANRQDETIIDLLNARLEDLSRVVLIQKQDNRDVIDLDDIINVTFTDDGRNLTFKLVGGDGDFSKDIIEISVNSPLGNAVYQKGIGVTCTYKVNNNPITIVINSKLDLNRESDSPQR